jgi:hypothetical protein
MAINTRNPFEAYAPPGTVKSEFTARSNGSKLLQWTAKRFPWIHLYSMSSVCIGNYSPLGNLKTATKAPALFGTFSGAAMYNPNTLLPLPIITGCDVSALGQLGTTRKAVVKVQCFSDEDLSELQKCYFIPGMDVRVQFGWNEACNGDIPEIYIDKPNRARAICEIRTLAQTHPAYDGFQGVVGNFKYSLQPDNTWSCEIEIISASEPFSQSNVSDSQCDCARKEEIETQEGDKKEVVKKNGQLYSILLDSFRDPAALTEWLGKIRNRAPATLLPHVSGDYRFYWGKARTEGGGDDSGMFEGTFFNDYDTMEPYISYGALEAAVNAYTLPNNKKYPYGRVDSSGIVLPIPSPNLTIATDPRVCYIPGGKYQDDLSFRNGDSFVVPAPPTAMVTGGVSICDIQLNVLYVMLELKKVLDGDRLMLTFLRNVLKGVNTTCGDIWNLDVVSDSETKSGCGNPDSGGQGGVLSVVDLKQYETATSYAIPSTVSNSSIRSFNLDLKLTDSMKTQALYAGGTQQKGSGNTNSGGDSTGCEGASMKPFYLGGTVENKAMPSAKRNEKAKCDCDEISNAEQAETPTLASLKDEVKDYVSNETCNALRNEVVKRIQELAEGETPAHCNTALPFDFGFECDGIGGFAFGQLVTADRIPASVRESFDFQITKVEHTITANDWVTKVSTVARANKS